VLAFVEGVCPAEGWHVKWETIVITQKSGRTPEPRFDQLMLAKASVFKLTDSPHTNRARQESKMKLGRTVH
jgi:hypothetical protein